MKEPYLQVTYRRGRAFAAYYYLPRASEDRCLQSRPHGSGLIVDYAADDRPIGIEITAPEVLALVDFNRVLRALGQPEATDGDLGPLHAA